MACPRQLATVLFPFAIVVAAAGTPAAQTTPGPTHRTAPVREVGGMGRVTSEACRPCHQDIVAEWQGSLHRGSWSDPLFLEAYSVERQAFCRRCHAPESDPGREPPPTAREEGVGCTTCHVFERAVVSVGAHGRLGPHDTVARSWMAGQQACEACHQFAFPGYSKQRDPMPMQDTVGEWSRSAFASSPCRDCHMPLVVDGSGRAHRSHRFRVQGDRAMLARSPAGSTQAADPGWWGSPSRGLGVKAPCRRTPR